jgi:glutaredoxin-like YruB-family protein
MTKSASSHLNQRIYGDTNTKELKMESVISHADFIKKTAGRQKSFLLLYKADGDQSHCAYENLEKAATHDSPVSVYAADVTSVRDIHTQYGITTVPSLLVFENGIYINNVKGCHDSTYYKTIMESAVFQAKLQAEGKAPKRVTVYSTPTCSWCNTLKSWLRKNGVLFADINVSRDQRAAEDLVRRTGQQGVPQTDINGQIVVGFNQQRLKELLEIE